LSSLLTVLIVALTSIGVVGLGIFSAYAAVIMILQAVSYHSSPVRIRALRLITGESQASGD
jgi:hypothetical protein